MINEKQIFSENMRINKFCDENERLFIAEISDESNTSTYQEIFEKYNAIYKEFAVKHNNDKRNLYTKLTLDSFEKHFHATEHYFANTHKFTGILKHNWKKVCGDWFVYSDKDYLIGDNIHCEMYPSIIDWHDENYHFWLSVKNKNDCLFSRRNGIKGKLLFGKSIRLRLFNFDMI